MIGAATAGESLLVVGQVVMGSETWLMVHRNGSAEDYFLLADLARLSGPKPENLSTGAIPATPTSAPTATPRPVDVQPTPTTQRSVEADASGGGWLQEYFKKGAGRYEVEILEGGIGSKSRGKEIFMIKKVVAAWAKQRGNDHAIQVQFDDKSYALLYLRGTPNTTTSSSSSPINGFCIEDSAKSVCMIAFDISAHGDIAGYVARVASTLPGQVIGFNNTSGEGNSIDSSYVIINKDLAKTIRGI